MANVTQIFCIVPNYWGKGATPEEARAACKKAGARSVKHRRVYAVTHDDRLVVSVNDMGGWSQWRKPDVVLENATLYALYDATDFKLIEDTTPKPKR